jgi:hypothetical protein
MSDITIERLQVEIESSSTSAEKGIDALSSSLERLRAATRGGAGLNVLSKRLNTLNSALSSINASNSNVLNKLSQGLSSLSNIKISSSLSNQLTNLGSAVQSLDGTDFGSLTSLATSLMPFSTIGKANLNSFISQLTKLPQAVAGLDSIKLQGFGSLASHIKQLTSALAPLSNMGKNNLTSFITQLSKLPKMTETLESIDMGTLVQQIQDLANAFTPLATQMQHISAGFASFPSRIQKLIKSTDALTVSNVRVGKSYVNLAAKLSIARSLMRGIVNTIGSWITKSNSYIEDINLFTASMGEYADSAKQYADTVSDIMGIDPGEWMRNEGLFMTLATGFGVVTDRAEIMSRNLTQLGYDISSFFNLSYADSMAKLQSGIAGELEPLRRIGYDLSVARLQQEAFRLGIEKSVQSMTQAEKAELRYYAIMTQVTIAQGDMARTLEAPSNQLRILRAQVEMAARSLGNIFIPILNAILPYAIAVTKAIRMIADEIALLAGFKLPEVDYSGIETITGSGVDDTLSDAAEKANELKHNLLGIDELNIISNDLPTSDLGLGGLDFELPQYDFLSDAVNTRVDEIMAKLQPFIDWVKNNLDTILDVVKLIGAAILGWKLVKFLANLKKASDLLGGMQKLTGVIEIAIGGLLIWDGWKKLSDFDPTNDLTGVLESIFGGLLVANGIKKLIGGTLGLTISRVFTLALSAYLAWQGWKMLADANVENDLAGVLATVFAFATAGFSVGNLLFKSASGGLFAASIGLSVAIFGIQILFPEQWENAMTQISDWINKVFNVTTAPQDIEIAINVATGILTGVTVLWGILNKIGLLKGNPATDAIKTVETISTGTSNVLNKMGALSKTLGLGIIIIAEVVTAAGLIVTAIWGLGTVLEQIGLAWEPVIANGETIAISMGIGVGILASIGVVTALLGTVGTPLIVDIALGTAILAEIGIATGLFIIEVWAIDRGLDEIGMAWEPVLSNGERIATAIGLGTALLVGIGVVTAALGVAAVASVGLLPIAIGLGTLMLLELGIAVGEFLTEIEKIGDSLLSIDSAWQPVLTNGERIADEIEAATDLLIGIGIVTAALGIASVASIGLLPLAIDIGTHLLIALADSTELFTDRISNIADVMNNRLSPALEELNGKLPTLTTNMSNFLDFMEGFAGYVVKFSKANSISGLAATIDTIIGWFTQDPIERMTKNVKEIYKQSKDLNENLEIAIAELEKSRSMIEAYEQVLKEVEPMLEGKKTSSGGLIQSAINLGANVIKGFTDGVKSVATGAINTVKNFGSSIINGIKGIFDIHSPSRVFYGIGENLILGFDNAVTRETKDSEKKMSDWASRISSIQPSMKFAVDPSSLDYYDVPSLTDTVSTSVSTASRVAVDTEINADSMETAMLNALVGSGLVADVRRQADKKETTTVQIGNRVITDAVTTQQRANGFRFVQATS